MVVISVPRSIFSHNSVLPDTILFLVRWSALSVLQATTVSTRPECQQFAPKASGPVKAVISATIPALLATHAPMMAE